MRAHIDIVCMGLPGGIYEVSIGDGRIIAGNYRTILYKGG